MPLTLGRLPLSFAREPSGGFAAHVAGAAFRVGPAGFAIGSGGREPGRRSLLELELAGASALARTRGEGRLPGRLHDLAGRDPARWRTGLPTFAGVRAAGVYPGTDVCYHGAGSRLEYDFELAPGADPGRIRLRFPGTTLAVTTAGRLRITGPGGAVVQRRPEAYQVRGGRRVAVACAYRIERGAPEVRLALSLYDRRLPLVIDPIVDFTASPGGKAVAVDAAGRAYLAGEAPDPLDETAPPDAFVTKLNAAGTQALYTTYFRGSGFDSPTALAVDGNGCAYLAGSTTSDDFPVLQAAQSARGGADRPGVPDAFLAKLDAAGAPVFATYLGGSGSEGAAGLAVDAAGAVYVAGSTDSDDFPTASPAQATAALDPEGAPSAEAFVGKLSASGGQWVYATYLGGGGVDLAAGIAVDASGCAYVAGNTDSPDFPTTPGALKPAATPIADGTGCSEAFVTKLSAAGTALVYSTFLGGSGGESVHGVAVDAAGQAVVGGSTGATDLPLAAPFQAVAGAVGSDQLQLDGFVTRLNAAGSALVHSSYLGGSGTDAVTALALDAAGNAYLIGETGSGDFPLVDADQAVLAGGENDVDLFLACVSPAGALLYASYYGTAYDDAATAVAVDGAGSVYLGGETLSSEESSPGMVEGCDLDDAPAGEAEADGACVPPVARSGRRGWRGFVQKLRRRPGALGVTRAPRRAAAAEAGELAGEAAGEPERDPGAPDRAAESAAVDPQEPLAGFTGGPLRGFYALFNWTDVDLNRPYGAATHDPTWFSSRRQGVMAWIDREDKTVRDPDDDTKDFYLSLFDPRVSPDLNDLDDVKLEIRRRLQRLRARFPGGNGTGTPLIVAATVRNDAYPVTYPGGAHEYWWYIMLPWGQAYNGRWNQFLTALKFLIREAQAIDAVAVILDTELGDASKPEDEIQRRGRFQYGSSEWSMGQPWDTQAQREAQVDLRANAFRNVLQYGQDPTRRRVYVGYDDADSIARGPAFYRFWRPTFRVGNCLVFLQDGYLQPGYSPSNWRGVIEPILQHLGPGGGSSPQNQRPNLVAMGLAVGNQMFVEDEEHPTFHAKWYPAYVQSLLNIRYSPAASEKQVQCWGLHLWGGNVGNDFPKDCYFRPDLYCADKDLSDSGLNNSQLQTWNQRLGVRVNAAAAVLYPNPSQGAKLKPVEPGPAPPSAP